MSTSHDVGRAYPEESSYYGELDNQEYTYLRNLSRADLIALLEDERRRNKRKRRNSEGEFDEDRQSLVESLRSQLEESEQRNRELQSVVRQLQTELDNRRERLTLPPILPPLMSRRGRTPGSSMSSGFSSLNLTPVDTRTSIATTVSTRDTERETISRLQTLNNSVVATASSLSRRIRYNDLLINVPDRKALDGVQASLVRATWLVGDRVANSLYTQPLPKNAADRDPPALLTQIVFEAIFAKWCALILGYSDDTIQEEGHSEVHDWQRTSFSIDASTPPNSEKWFTSIMSCIHDIMMIAGWSFKKSTGTDSKIPLSPVITAIQELRKTLDEISSASYHVSVYIPKPGTVFNQLPHMMTDAFGSGSAKRSIFGIKKRTSTNDRIVATTGLGLQTRMERMGPPSPPLAPPRVVLERTFYEAFSSSPELEEQPVRIRVGGGRSVAIAPVKVRLGG